MKKALKWISGGLLAVFVLLQFTNPPRTNPPVVHDLFQAAATNAPPHIVRLLHTACYDCHSSETRWPWYSRVAPISWLVVNDVKDGREQFSFSDWPVADPAYAAKRFDAVSELVQYGDMPPKKYTLIHRDARLTTADREEISKWADGEAKQIRASLKPE